jgi:hypothetical protein
MRQTTYCWNCCAEYPASAMQCPACCATNANIDLDKAGAEECGESQISHDWRYLDDSVDHEFGRQFAFHWECERCGKDGGQNVGINMKGTGHARQ